MIEIRLIDSDRRGDINIPNEPFRLSGRMLPEYRNGKWSYGVERLPDGEAPEMCFPDENYDYDAMKERSVFVGAYDGEKCVGLAILQHDWFRYMYLYDLKVNGAYRRQGVGRALIDKAMEISAEHGYIGLYTQGQDNNLAACMFYINAGFRIGGLNTDVYRGTAQEGKADIYFYRDR